MKPILRSSAVLLAAFASLAGASRSPASIVNGGFENGDFLGWSGVGIESVQGTEFGIEPSDGNFQARMDSQQAASPASVEDQLGVPRGTLDQLIGAKDSPAYHAISGSAITQSISVVAGQVLSFDWNMATNESGGDHGDDFVAWTLVGLQSGSILASVEDYGQFHTTGDVFVRQETGYRTVSYVIPTTGVYTLGFAAVDTITDFQPSYLWLDNVILTPEPGTLTVFGLAAFAFLRRRNRQDFARNSHCAPVAIAASCLVAEGRARAATSCQDGVLEP